MNFKNTAESRIDGDLAEEEEWLSPNIGRPFLPASKRGILFDEDELPSVMPKLFGNHRWYFHVMTRQRYKAFASPNKYHGVIAPSWTEGKRGEWKDALVVFRPVIMPGCAEELVDHIGEIAHSTGKSIILKQVHVSLVDALIEAGCRRYRDAEGWNGHYKYDDQNRPEVVLKIDDVHKTREQDLLDGLSRRANRSWDRFDVVEHDFGDNVEFIHPKRLVSQLLAVFMGWREHFIRRYQTYKTYEFIGWHVEAIDRIVAERDHRLFIAKEKQKSELAGFCYLTGSGDRMDMAMSFCDFRENDVHKLLYRKVLKILSEDGVRYVNMGGSEEENLYKFKKKIWDDSFDVESTHLIFSPD
jgi:hypothetical protein